MSVKNKSFLVSDNDVFLDVNLTVSESKRLIAKGIINMPLVKDKLQKGMIIITKGSTNSYIAEEQNYRAWQFPSWTFCSFWKKSTKY